MTASRPGGDDSECPRWPQLSSKAVLAAPSLDRRGCCRGLCLDLQSGRRLRHVDPDMDLWRVRRGQPAMDSHPRAPDSIRHHEYVRGGPSPHFNRTVSDGSEILSDDRPRGWGARGSRSPHGRNCTQTSASIKSQNLQKGSQLRRLPAALARAFGDRRAPTKELTGMGER